MGYVKLITWYGEPAAVACDGKCNKAWGINSRPRRQLSDDEDDYVYLSDAETGEAPLNPGTYEGDCSKPHPDSAKLNKWCVRECERSELYGHLDKGNPAEPLPDFDNPQPNILQLTPSPPSQK